MLEAALGELRREARRSSTVLDAAVVGMVLLDADGTYRAVNRRHREFLALAYPEGHAGRAGQEGDVFGADRATRLRREELPSWRASHGEEFDDLLVWVGRDPARRRALSVTARAVRDAGGGLDGSVVSYLDVTDLVRALEVKDDFVATVSHELRTPLTSIIGYLDVVQDRPDLDDQVRSHLDVVGRNATRLLTLVTELLHPAAQGADGVVLRRLPEDVAALARDAVRAAGRAAREAGLHLEARCSEPVVALVDRERLLEVLGHLVGNAVRYNRQGGSVVVSVRAAEAGSDAPREAVVEVRDTGVGIPAAERDQVFEPFVRGEHAREQAVQGVGLGLTISRSVVAAHGGRITVHSVAGEGTTVRAHLPVPGLDRAPEVHPAAPVAG
nr:PAS domain-containing sensor histidine kinase [Nocardioides perillae]